MRNKSVIQKRSSKIKFYKTLKNKIRKTIIKISLYDSLMLRSTMLKSFQNLVNVTLQECKINFLPKEFGTLHHLQEITLFSNYDMNTTQPSWEWLKQIPVRNNLKLLNINYNDLSKLPLQIICLKNLTKLNMKGNRIVSLPKEFGNLPLLNLNLSHNNLGRAEQFAWEWLMQTPIRNNLIELNLMHNNITAIPSQINCMTNLQALYLCENKINFLPKEFGTLSQMLKLDLSDNFFGTYSYTTWEWLEGPIKDSLLMLDISNNFLTEFPLQITRVTNLQMLDIGGNKIDYLPKELGTLSHLQFLDISFNLLGKSDRNTWEWLEQTAVRNKLSTLLLCENFLTELPPQIGKLDALITLDLIGNELKCLSHNFANLKNLKVLDLYDNNLLYLPGNMAHLSAEIDVGKNQFNLEDNSNDDLTTSSEIPSLMECSADVILKSRLNYTNHQHIVLPQALVRYLDEAKYCFFCGIPCFRYYEKRFIKFSEYDNILNIKFYGAPNIVNANFECYACSSKCAEKLRN